MDTIPLFPLNNVLFPHQILPIHVFEERYKLMLRDCLRANAGFGVALIRSGLEVGGSAQPFEIGTEAKILEMQQSESDGFDLVVVGGRRFRLRKLLHSKPYLEAEVEWLQEPHRNPEALKGLIETARYLYLWLLADSGEAWTDGTPAVVSTPESLSFGIASRLDLDLLARQMMLETPTAEERLTNEIGYLMNRYAPDDGE